jgi:tRNA-2-methylthio-N6-dimethylallyladenosine synthase
MDDQIPDAVKAARNSALLEAAERVAAARASRLVGRVLPVLVDGAARRNASEAAGRTRCNRVVNFDARGRARIGDVVPVRITQTLPHSLRGELLDDGGRSAGEPAEEGATCGWR